MEKRDPNGRYVKHSTHCIFLSILSPFQNFLMSETQHRGRVRKGWLPHGISSREITSVTRIRQLVRKFATLTSPVHSMQRFYSTWLSRAISEMISSSTEPQCWEAKTPGENPISPINGYLIRRRFYITVRRKEWREGLPSTWTTETNF